MKQIVKFSLFITIVLAISSCAVSKKTTFVLLPDTQYYTEKYPEILHAQADWVIDNANEFDFVLHQGDLTQNNSPEEWETIHSAYSDLQTKLPCAFAVGNHDMGSEPGKFADTRNTTLFNQTFPFEKMSQTETFAGAFESGKMDNVFYRFKKGKQKWLILNLEFGPRNEVLNWADEVAKQNPDHTIILNTHCYMYSDSTRQSPGDYWRPQNYGIGEDTGLQAVNDGEDIWNKLVKINPNIRFVLSGHVLKSGVGTLISLNDKGYPVYQMLANYQTGVKGSENGGNGYLRILVFNEQENTVTVETFSPYLNKYKETPDHNFIIQSVSLSE